MISERLRPEDLTLVGKTARDERFKALKANGLDLKEPFKRQNFRQWQRCHT